MRRTFQLRWAAACAAAMALGGLAAGAAAQDLSIIERMTREDRADPKSFEPTPPPSAPRDFTGVWEVSRFARTQGDTTPPTKPVFTAVGSAEVKRLSESEAGGRVVADAGTQCFPHGVPRLVFSPYPIRFTYMPGKILMLHEVNHNVRVVHMDRTAPPPGAPRTFLGYSVGHWEGDTLVIVTTLLNDQTRIEANVPRGPRLKVTERWTKAKNKLGVTDLVAVVTAEDPDFLAQPWTRRLYFAYRSDVERDIRPDGLVEYSCEENNRNAPGADHIVTAK